MSTTAERALSELTLNRRFRAADVKTRQQSGQTFHYIDIAATIARLNELDEWSFVESSTKIEITEATDRRDNRLWLATVSGHLTIGESTRLGSGCGVSSDQDMAVKTAQAEALKKAGHLFGIGLYLWDERERSLVDLVNAGEFKAAVALLARIEGVPVEKDAIESAFGGDPSDELGQRAILEGAGLL